MKTEKPQKCIRIQKAMVSNRNPKPQIDFQSKNLTCKFDAFYDEWFSVNHRRERSTVISFSSSTVGKKGFPVGGMEEIQSAPRKGFDKPAIF